MLIAKVHFFIKSIQYAALQAINHTAIIIYKSKDNTDNHSWGYIQLGTSV